MTIPSFRTVASWLALTALAVVAVAPMDARAQAPGTDAAEKILRRMTDYISSLQQVSVDTQATIEVVYDSGQKIQFDSATSLMMSRPNKLRAERRGDLISQTFYYDGKTLTIYNPSDKFYASVPAPATIDAMLDFARDSLGIVQPAGDFVHSNSFALLTQDVTSGFVVGKAVIGGVKCDHLAFRSQDVDWQVWIADGDKPLLRKFVITTKDVPGQPQFALVTTNWNVQPNLDDGRFTFVPPQGAKQVDFLPSNTGSAPAR